LNPSITGAQIRAARAFLSWTARDLAKLCGVSHSAISRAERSDGVPAMQRRNLDAIQHAFEQHGVEFIGDVGLRVRRR
jgi:transcriptional regulator with XRE-family HTH domain